MGAFVFQNVTSVFYNFSHSLQLVYYLSYRTYRSYKTYTSYVSYNVSMASVTLETPLATLPFATRFLKPLARLKIETVRQLLRHFPVRYEDYSALVPIEDLTPDSTAAVTGVVREINSRRAWHKHMSVTEAVIADETGGVRAVWFNQPYLEDTLRIGTVVNLAGKLVEGKNGLQFSHPTVEVMGRGDAAHMTREPIHTGRLVPIYPETEGITSRGLRYLSEQTLRLLGPLVDPLPESVRAEQRLPELRVALGEIHFPESLAEAEIARRRFSFEDIFVLELANFHNRAALASHKAPVIPPDINDVKKMLASLPFQLTTSQKSCLWEIMKDMGRAQPMNRLLQGDVGSGKTIVALLAATLAAHKGYQTAFMAPTEILARQHYATATKFLGAIHGKLSAPAFALLVGSGARVHFGRQLETEITKPRLHKLVENREVRIIFGTHALIQKAVTLPELGLVVVDEQHRFGIRQRHALASRTNTDLTQTNTDRAQTNTDSTRTITEINGVTNQDKTREKSEFVFENITYNVRGAIFAVKKELGLGHKEIIYQNALAQEFEKRGILYEKEKSININYNDKKVGIYRPDFVVEKKIIVELKALPFVGKFEKSQIWHYLKASDYRLALLVNFGKEDISIDRIIYGYDDHTPSQLGSVKSVSSRSKSVIMPHLLSMTATPIPRTLALTIFGDLDISAITEKPVGRQEIITKVVTANGRTSAYDLIRQQIKLGRQAFVICPRITRTDTDGTRTKTETLNPYKQAVLDDVKTVTEEYEKLSKKIFPEFKVAMLHGQMPSKSSESASRQSKSVSSPRKSVPSKEEVMRAFSEGKTDILVSTSVVEVGVDIPNATVMMIEGSDRFGLAQLYQFRGRVGRGEHQSYCLLLSEVESVTGRKRLEAVAKAKNGLQLAEYDLKVRGPGEYLGERQSGLADTAMAALQNPELVKIAREAAENLLATDPELIGAAELRERLAEFRRTLHQE